MGGEGSPSSEAVMRDGTIVFPQFGTGWKNMSIAGGLRALVPLHASSPMVAFPGLGLSRLRRA